MTELDCNLEKANVEDAKRLGLIGAREALRRLVVIQGKRAKTVIDEARQIKLKED